VSTDGVDSSIESAQRALQERRWADALKALDAIPTERGSAESLNLRGRALVGLARRDDAREAFRAAIEADPSDPRPRSNLALLLRDEGSVDEAIALLEQALDLSGPSARTYANLANTLVIAGRHADAETAYRRSLALDRGIPALLGLARLLARAGRYDEATVLYVDALSRSAVRMEVLLELADAAGQARALERASDALIPIARGATTIETARTLARFGASHGMWALAEVAAERGCELDDTDVDCTLISARALVRRGEAERAERLLADRAPRLGKASIWLERAELAGRLHGLDRKARLLDEAARALPHSGAVLAKCGAVRVEYGRFAEGEQLLRQALALEPTNAQALNSLAVSRLSFRRHAEARALLERLVALHPLRSEYHSNLVFMRHYEGASRSELYAAHVEFANKFQWARPVARQARDADPERRIRLGYLSADLFDHSISRFLEPLLRAHDRRAFEVHCFAAVANPDAVTERLRRLDVQWHDVSARSEADIARAVAEAGIDVLVDLGGHTASNHLRVFAYRPAPVAVTYLGYPNTTGLSCIDYRITDAVVDPLGDADVFATEELLRLPGPAWCYEPGVDVPICTSAEGPITFACFNALQKVTDTALATWSRILARVPGSILAFKSWSLGEPEVRASFLDDCARHGVDRSRIEVRGFVPTRAEHLALLGSAHVALDTFPYNGTTTSCDALWMGVPVVTLLGEAHAGRVTASLVRALGLDDLVAEDLDGYVERAVALANDRELRLRLRRELRERFASSSLGSAAAFMPGYEARLREAWASHCEDVRAERAPRSGELRLPVGGGVRLFVPGDVTRPPCAALIEHGAWPEPELDASSKLLARGGRALDLGTAAGAYALRWAASVGRSGSVVAVDADERALERLARSGRAEGLEALSVRHESSTTWMPDAELEPPQLVRLSGPFTSQLESLRAQWRDTLFVVALGADVEVRQSLLDRLSALDPLFRWVESFGIFAPIDDLERCDESIAAVFLPPCSRDRWAATFTQATLGTSTSPRAVAYEHLRALARSSTPPITPVAHLEHARRLAKLGALRAAARALEPLIDELPQLRLTTPFEPLLDRYAELGDVEREGWLEAQLLEASLLWSTSSIVSGDATALHRLGRLFALGYAAPRTARSLGLLASREGRLA
jgi:predicted O-linked N-acetylglucosamine transferase (SPINDLY family)